MTSAVMSLAVAVLIFGTAAAGMLRGADPWATWFYPLAWYPTLLGVDAVLRIRTGRWYLLSDWRFAAAALLWSVPFWLLFELINFRVANWYYVFVPPDAASRWTGITLSFATVLPAILISKRAVEHAGFTRKMRSRTWSVSDRLPWLLQGLGVAFIVLAMVWPRLFFPLIWGAVTLLADPWVYRRDPERSLLGALERGRPAVIADVLIGGLAIGFLWELYNTQARGHWIYTVPGLEELKLFEMPVLGFLGFPILALDGWAIWNVLVLAGLAREPGGEPERPSRHLRTLGCGVASLVFSVGILAGMERYVITSVTPSLTDVAGDAAPRLASVGYDVFSLAEADPDGIVSALSEPDGHVWVQSARLVTLRGIGAANAERLRAVGIISTPELAAADPDELFTALMAIDAPHVTPARVRVWVRGARGRR